MPTTSSTLFKSLGIEVYEPGQPSLITVDEAKMTATGLLTTSGVDRDRDIIETSGIDTSLHRLNPVVLLDHGLWHPLPIGKTEDEAGNYTVFIGDNEATQTTYFSQHNRLAEQTFQLICEKVLRGNSIRFENPVYKRLPNGGKHVTACQLVEVSWVVLPANPECVTALLDSGLIGGKALEPALKSMLTPHRLPKKVWSNGMDKYQKDAEPMSAVDEAHGGALREEKSDDRDEPYGATALRNLHADLKAMYEDHCASVNKLEQAKVKKHLEKMIKHLQKHISEAQELFKSEYADHDPLDEVKFDDGEEESSEESGEEEPQEEPEEEPKEEKSAEPTADQLKRLARLERELMRKAKLLRRIGR